MMGTTGGTTSGSSKGSAKLGIKGLAVGLRPNPGEEGGRTGDACGGKSFAPGEVGLFTEDEEDERDLLACFWADLASLCSLGWNSCAVVLGERRGAGLGVSKDSPKVEGTPGVLMSLKENRSLLLLTLESLTIHEASEGERGGAEANTSPFGIRPGLGLGWEAGLKAEVSSSGLPCIHSWRELSNLPLSTMSPPGEKGMMLLPKFAFSVSIRRSNESSG